MMIGLRYIATVLFIALALCADALTLDDAKKMYLNGDYASALPVFRENLESRPKDATLNHWVGVCLLRTGNAQEALPLLQYAHSKGIVESPRYLAEIALKEYRMDEAAEYIEAYRAALENAGASMSKEAEMLVSQVSRATDMLERVERVVIIDSVVVDEDIFLAAYKLSPESGALSNDLEGVSYVTENSRLRLWVVRDTLGNKVVAEATALIDGEWDEPHLIDELSEDGNVDYPFLMPDGTTLYFAADGYGSIGGYDIFVTNRSDDGFLDPQNVGMPYNSPFNDYMLAIDEVTGVGWWATDRNCEEGKVTIYKFIPNEMRVNYPSDTDSLIAYARVSSIKDTWEEGADYSEVLQRVERVRTADATAGEQFRISLPGERIYTSLDDFTKEEARERMTDYLSAVERYNAETQRLAGLRQRYADGETSLATEILEIEREQLNGRRELERILNDVIRLEIN